MNEVETFLNKIPQGVILTGIDLSAVYNFARRWASRLLNCSEDKVEQHPDFFCVRPSNKMRQIGVDTMRELGKNVLQSPNRADRKVFVVYEADCLQRPAANAFLKILEEPPADTSLFLVTTRPFDLLPTLRSRCWWIAVSSQGQSLLNDTVKAWTETLRTHMEAFLKGQAMDVMEMYALLYRFQAYLTSSLQEIKNESDDELDAEELAAQKAGLEKLCVKQFFVAIEETMGELFRQSQEKAFLYQRWIEGLEKAWRRVEVNFNPTSALESFLLSLC